MDSKQIRVDINRDKANSLGISMSDIANSLNILIGAPQSSLVNWDGRSYPVILQLYHRYMSTEQSLKLINIRSQNQKLLPLGNIVSLHPAYGALNLNHFQQLPAYKLILLVKHANLYKQEIVCNKSFCWH
jgi:multidrug efflux pump subunit AcrB